MNLLPHRLRSTLARGDAARGEAGPGITRRGAIRAAGATAVAGATIGILAGCTNTPEREIPSEPVVVGSDDATVVTGEDGDFAYVDLDFAPTATWELPPGNVVLAGEGTWLPVVTAGSSAAPVTVASALNVSTGELATVVPQPVDDDVNNVAIYDVRCSDSAFAWVELNLLTRAWTLYAATLTGGALSGTPTALYSANADWSPPYLAVTGTTVIWQVMPTATGARSTERSTCYLWHAGDANATAVVESLGRFATAPAVSGTTVTLAPRVRTEEGVYYGVTAYDLADDLATTIDRIVMPQGVRPFYATRIGDTFALSVEANYDSGGLLGRMGTYFGTADGPFTNIPLEPYADVAGSAVGMYVVKVRASYLVIDTARQRYAALPAVNRSVDYGEYPARAGETSSFATYATVKDADTGYPTTVVVRTFDLPTYLPDPAEADGGGAGDEADAADGADATA